MSETKLQKCWVWNKDVSDFVKSKADGYNIPSKEVLK
jgi:hypothetical protein